MPPELLAPIPLLPSAIQDNVNAQLRAQGEVREQAGQRARAAPWELSSFLSGEPRYTTSCLAKLKYGR